MTIGEAIAHIADAMDLDGAPSDLVIFAIERAGVALITLVPIHEAPESMRTTMERAMTKARDVGGRPFMIVGEDVRDIKAGACAPAEVPTPRLPRGMFRQTVGQA